VRCELPLNLGYVGAVARFNSAKDVYSRQVRTCKGPTRPIIDQCVEAKDSAISKYGD
jgi:hypothetical protein